jgi:WD40 repeat protein
LAALYGKRNTVLEQVAGDVQVWQLASGQSQPLPAHPAFTLAFAPDGQTLATEELNGAMNLWDPGSAEHRQRFSAMGVRARLSRVVFNPDGKSILASIPGGVQLRDTSTGRILATLRGHSGTVVDAAFAMDGRRLALGTHSLPMEDMPPPPAEIHIWERVE